jgi:hypothetical protein
MVKLFCKAEISHLLCFRIRPKQRQITALDSSEMLAANLNEGK